MVNTQWRCWQAISLKAMELVRSMEYLLPQEEQKRVWQRKGTNFSSPHFVQPYMAPPNAGSPQLIIRSTVSITC